MKAGLARWRPRTATLCLGVLLASLALATRAWSGIQTDVALTPPEGSVFLRLQYRGARAVKWEERSDQSALRTTAVYGWRSNLALLASAAVVHRSRVAPDATGTSISGISDLTLLARFRFVQVDWVGGTFRAAVLGGGTLPIATDALSANTVTGTAVISLTWRRGMLFADADVQGELVPEHDDVDPGEGLRYNLALGYQVPAGAFSLIPLVELNGEGRSETKARGVEISGTEGSELFLSPGLQISFEDFIFEGSVQVPVGDSYPAERNGDDLR